MQAPHAAPPRSRASRLGVAYVTGGAERIGAKLSVMLAQEGFDLVLFSRDAQKSRRKAKEIASAHGIVGVGLAMDCRDEHSVRAAFAQAVKALSPPDLLLHCASCFEKDDASSFTYEYLRRAMDINCAAALTLTSLVASMPMPAKRNVVLMGDYVTARTPERFISYSASKKALEYTMRQAALSFAPHGVRVNMIAPSYVIPAPRQSQAHFNEMCERMPLKGPVGMTDLYKCLRFLMETDCITGQTLYADGGLHLAPKPYA